VDWRIWAVILVVIVATAIFVLILRANQRRVDRFADEAEARGESLPKRPQLGMLYFVLGAAFLVIGVLLLLFQR
jgi:uncharacterized membrane protein